MLVGSENLRKNVPHIKTLNWQITLRCNYNCKFCSVHKLCNKIDREVKSPEQAHDLLDGIKKIDFDGLKVECLNLVGGDPLMHPLFHEILKIARESGFSVWVTTNGSNLNKENILSISRYAKGITIPIDSLSNLLEKELRCGAENHVSYALELADLIHEQGLKLAINTIVTKKNCQENLRALIKRLDPHRWNVYQILPREFRNTEYISEKVDEAAFQEFVRKHSHVRLRCGTEPYFKNEEDILNSYFVLTPEGIIKNLKGTIKIEVQV
ncbi:radical SAM protein [Methanosarcina sp. KYL-1]|uniref:radical SAM protein n=1 Tax=Methanosarcina sp. KYL-1 TaxID=2602068 RepID=UPI0021011EFE|nr:radical SAM protein [Methanosarcina sp. KYL-1]MCQ1535389.1 radical SAM protein [Methanosarcina sp. KYL-1]